ncbi:MAG: hypothetical protein IPL06_09790 [Betaproteobacteria bacterium]|nr:hypothetical protein [Betaproteobacteria bacterium]
MADLDAQARNADADAHAGTGGGGKRNGGREAEGEKGNVTAHRILLAGWDGVTPDNAARTGTVDAGIVAG